MGKERISVAKKKSLTPTQKKIRDAQRYTEDPDAYTIEECWSFFIVNRRARQNAEASLDAYKRFYKKLSTMIPPDEHGLVVPRFPISMLDDDGIRTLFIESLKRKDGKDISPQTVNHYLRSYRAFGNFCVDEGYLAEGFSCPIKEVEPPLKDVYTEAELKRLLKEPDLEDFVAYRSYAIINLMLSTGARSNTIRNLRIRDFNAETGYIKFNTTKAHKVIEIGLDPKCVYALNRYKVRWRSSAKEDNPDDFLFCNCFREQISRDTLCKSIAAYNKSRGVDKTSLHLFRHTFAKMWITSGGDIVSLARVLTHTELEMVKRYANLYSADVKKEVEEHSVLAQLKTEPKKSIKKRAKE